MNAYVKFGREMRHRLQEDDTNSFSDISKIIGEAWRQLDPAEKARLTDEAEVGTSLPSFPSKTSVFLLDRGFFFFFELAPCQAGESLLRAHSVCFSPARHSKSPLSRGYEGVPAESEAR